VVGGLCQAVCRLVSTLDDDQQVDVALGGGFTACM